MYVYQMLDELHGLLRVVYSQACLVSTLKGTPNLYFLSEVLTTSTVGHSVHELGTK